MNDLFEGHAALRRSLVVLAVMAACSMAVGATAVIYWNFFDNDPPIVYDPLQSYTMDANGVRTDVFRPGDTMLLNRQFCVDEATQALMDRRLISITTGRSFGIDTYLLNLPVGCINGVRPITIPKWVAPDVYRMVVTGTYPRNILRQGSFTAPEVIIEVTR